MRGKTFHNYMAQKTGHLLTCLEWLIYFEFCICKNGIINFVDIFAIKDNTQIAFEIESTARHITRNCIKAQASDIALCIIVPDSKVYKSAIEQVSKFKNKSCTNSIKIFKLNQLQQGLANYLSLLIAANSNTDK